jgi:hypothetical protein
MFARVVSLGVECSVDDKSETLDALVGEPADSEGWVDKNSETSDPFDGEPVVS